jgi:hypothetical protein
MKIAVLGTGTMGSALARAFARNGHQVTMGSRERSRAVQRAAALEPVVRGASADEAVDSSDVCVLAVRWEDAREMLSAAGDFGGKVLIDATNPEGPDGRTLSVGHTISGAEMVDGWARGARVVKAFNCIYAEALDVGAGFGAERASLFFCGDDAEAKKLTAGLGAEMGFEPVDSGVLQNARLLEPAAALLVELVRVQGREPAGVALKLLTRAEGGNDG